VEMQTKLLHGIPRIAGKCSIVLMSTWLLRLCGASFITNPSNSASASLLIVLLLCHQVLSNVLLPSMLLDERLVRGHHILGHATGHGTTHHSMGRDPVNRAVRGSWGTAARGDVARESAPWDYEHGGAALAGCCVVGGQRVRLRGVN